MYEDIKKRIALSAVMEWSSLNFNW